MDTHTCSKCLETKSVTEFYPSSSHKSGYQAYCGDCVRAYKREHYQRTKEDQKARGKRRKRGEAWKYHGLSLEQYEALVERAQGLCEVCNMQPFAVIDHNHSCCSGMYGCAKCVRGLLCQGCNKMLGFARDNTEVLSRAIGYLS